MKTKAKKFVEVLSDIDYWDKNREKLYEVSWSLSLDGDRPVLGDLSSRLMSREVSEFFLRILFPHFSSFGFIITLLS